MDRWIQRQQQCLGGLRQRNSTSNWVNTTGNTSTSLVPGSTTTVTFSAASPTNESAMVLGAFMSIAGLVVNDVTTAISLNADGNAH